MCTELPNVHETDVTVTEAPVRSLTVSLPMNTDDSVALSGVALKGASEGLQSGPQRLQVGDLWERDTRGAAHRRQLLKGRVNVDRQGASGHRWPTWN